MKKHTTQELNSMKFSTLAQIASSIPLTENGRFMSKLTGYILFYKGREVKRYELWGIGLRDADAIIENKVKFVTCRAKKS